MYASVRLHQRARGVPGTGIYWFFAGWLGVFLLGACAGEEGQAPSAPAQECGTPTGWDSDGDGISDAVELANADLFAPGTCDADRSRSVGDYAAGSLEGGINLPDTGAGYSHFVGSDPRDADDWGTLDLIDCLERVGRELDEVGLTFHVGDLSKRQGGPFFPHKAHQVGREVDVRYARKDLQDLPVDLRLEMEDYDPLATRDLFERLSRNCPVSVIFADVQMLQFAVDSSTMAPVVDDPDRRNHFMVRLKK